MSDSIDQAFDHPEARSRAAGPGVPHDRISLRDHVVDVEIGAFQSERGTRQRVRFNVVVEVRPVADTAEDDVDRILSYDTITEAIAAVLRRERLNLLETLAERVADDILLEPLALRCFVRVEKLDRGPGALGVEIVRSAADRPRRAGEADAPAPVVAFLSEPALESDGLAACLDRIAARGAAVLCLGVPEGAYPQSGEPRAQRRIDLLAIEQNCWRLAGRDPRCLVVDSRTEIDWAVRHGQLVVWAPAKIVLDAVDRPAPDPRDAVPLALWFAGLIEAREVLVVGAAAPETDLPLTVWDV